MGNDQRAARTDRAVSNAVTHALALAITAVLISGLLVSVGTMVTDQRQYSAREQLLTIGNRLAEEMTRAAAMAQDGGNVTISTHQPTEIAGKSYAVSLSTGPDCQTPIVSADTCLVLSMVGGNAEVTVPVRNETAVSFDASSTGTYTITAIRNASAEPESVPAIERDLRVGVGEELGEYEQGSDLNLSNRDPIAGFTFTPGEPTVDSVIHFENDTEDLDGKIVGYEWELGDGTTKTNVSEFNHSYSSPGKYSVTMTVTDDDGETDNVTKVVSVGGLVYRDDVSAINVRPGGPADGQTFSVENKHGDQAEIQELLIDPANDTIDSLDAGSYGDEIHIAGDDDSGGQDGSFAIFDDGRIYDIQDEGTGAARLSQSSNADVWFRGYQDSGSEVDMINEEVFVAMHYRVGGSFYTAQFTLNGPGGTSNDPPDPSFTVSCTDKTCNFDGTGSSDDSPPLSDYEWQFGDGDSVSGASADQPSHTYAANGSYDVSLTVTDSDGVSSTLTKTVDVGAPDSVVVWTVNAGGAEYTDSEGITYGRDTSSNPHDDLASGSQNNVYSTGSGIGGTSDDALYQSERWGAFGYDIDVTNGDYQVTFKFAEIWFDDGDEDERIFDVELEGNTVIDDLDINDEVGATEAMQISRTVNVDDGTLDIDYDHGPVDNPKASAIVVRRVDAYQYGTDNVTMEAEHFMARTSGVDGVDDMSDVEWVEISDPAAGGGNALEADPDPGRNAQDSTDGERLDYYVDFPSDGTYYVWVRMKCAGGSADSIHVGLDGSPASYGGNGLTSNDGSGCDPGDGWTWMSDADGDQVDVYVGSAGRHTVNVWMREDGVKIDRIVLSKTDSEPTGMGPPESPTG